MLKKLITRCKDYLGHYRIFKKLRDKYPHLKRFPELEEAMGDWDKARNYLIELEQRGYVEKRDYEKTDFTDDFYYGLTPNGLDKLSEEFSLWRRTKPILKIILGIFIAGLSYYLGAYLIKRYLK